MLSNAFPEYMPEAACLLNVVFARYRLVRAGCFCGYGGYYDPDLSRQGVYLPIGPCQLIRIAMMMVSRALPALSTSTAAPALPAGIGTPAAGSLQLWCYWYSCALVELENPDNSFFIRISVGGSKTSAVERAPANSKGVQ